MAGIAEDSVRFAPSGPSRRFLRGLRPLVSIGPTRCPCPRVDTPPQSMPSSPLNLYATDNSALQVVERNGNRCQCLCQDVERKNLCQCMVFRSTVASHPPLSGYSAPEGHFPAQRLGGSQSNRVLTRPGTKKRDRRIGLFQGAQSDSNRRHSEPQSDALTN